MDGNNRTLLVQTRNTFPLGLALDSSHRRLYWVASPGTLAFFDLNQSVAVQVLSGASSIGVSFGLTLDETHLYWTDANTSGVYRADKPTGENITKILPWLGSLRDIRAYNLLNLESYRDTGIKYFFQQPWLFRGPNAINFRSSFSVSYWGVKLCPFAIFLMWK